MVNVNDVLGSIHLDDLFIAFLIVGTIYVAVDGLTRLGVLKGENGRKAIHISVGVWAATFPLFLNRTEIFIFHGVFFVALVTLSFVSDFLKYHQIAQNNIFGRFVANIFDSYEDVSRWTIGQFLYPLSLMLVVLFFDDLAIYSFSVLILALGDGFAAVIGKPYGRIIYFVPGGKKSLLGSFTFFCITFTLLVIFALFHTSTEVITPVLVLMYAFALTITEGLTAGGFDNLTVPIISAILLSTL